MCACLLGGRYVREVAEVHDLLQRVISLCISFIIIIVIIYVAGGGRYVREVAQVRDYATCNNQLVISEQ